MKGPGTITNPIPVPGIEVTAPRTGGDWGRVLIVALIVILILNALGGSRGDD